MPATVLLHDSSFNMDYATLESREATFAPPSKRSKTGGWPLKAPTPTELAKAGFFYKPSPHSNDNTECFMCTRNLDGWEEDDDPVEEHLKHSEECAWALLMSTGAEKHYEPSNMEDPTGQRLTEARRATFAIGWPHDSKRAWIPKTEKMVEAGWHFAPTPESEDYSSCIYCRLSLDGWEPKDNPFDEHYSRSPDCPFFTFAGTTAPSKRPKAKKGRTSRVSRTSKASSRLSTQSNMSTRSEGSGIPDLDESIDVDSSNISMMSTASTATTKGKRKGTGRAKGTKTKKTKSTKAPKEDEIHDIVQMEVEIDKETTPTVDSIQPPEEEISYPQIQSETETAAENAIEILHDEERSQNEATPRQTSPALDTEPLSIGPPEREGSVIPVLASSPVTRASIRSQARSPPKSTTRSPLRQVARMTTPELPGSPSQQSDLENAPPSTRPESVRPPVSSPGSVPPKWTAVEVEIVLQNMSATPGVIAAMDTSLSAAEQQMTVQNWIRHIASKAEQDLRNEGERVVGIFETEGQRALRVLEGIVCV